MESMICAQKWLDKNPSLQNIFASAQNDAIQDIVDVGYLKLIFRPPALKVKWSELLAYANSLHAPSLCLVSDDDLCYWLNAKKDSLSESYFMKSR
jgi:hypothetical protein